MIELVSVIFRALIGFSVLLAMMRLLGKKQLGHITFFTYITGIALGNIAGDMVVHKDVKVIDAVIGISFWTLLTYILEYSSLKSDKIRVVLNGEPTIVIKKGMIIKEALAKQKLSMDDLIMLLRNNNVFSIKDVEYAILEVNGGLSILKKPANESVIRKDLQIPVGDSIQIPTEVIVDGKLINNNLKELNLTQEWIYNQLDTAGLAVKDVLFAQYQNDNSLYILKEQDAK